jgi:hypothetical protein
MNTICIDNVHSDCNYTCNRKRNPRMKINFLSNRLATKCTDSLQLAEDSLFHYEEFQSTLTQSVQACGYHSAQLRRRLSIGPEQEGTLSTQPSYAEGCLLDPNRREHSALSTQHYSISSFCKSCTGTSATSGTSASLFHIL